MPIALRVDMVFEDTEALRRPSAQRKAAWPAGSAVPGVFLWRGDPIRIYIRIFTRQIIGSRSPVLLLRRFS